MNARVLRLVVIAATSVAMTGLPGVAAARSAPPASWRLVAILRHCGTRDSLLSVTSTGARDAWALGQPNGGGPGCNADLEHWDGTTWRRVPVPRRAFLGIPLIPSGMFSFPLAASSATDAWIFPVRNVFDDYSHALQWNGRTWRRSSFPVRLTVQSAAAFSPRDVWAFGWVHKGQAREVPAAARYDGRAWHLVKIPGAPQAISAPSRHDLWAVGPTRATAGQTPARQQIIAMRWTGRGWHVVAVPKIPLRRGPEYATVGVVAAGPHDLWWCYRLTSRVTSHIGLIRLDGARWHLVHVPTAISDAAAITADGRGGVWLLADGGAFSTTQWWYHYRNGHWARQRVPSPRGYLNELFGMALVPGTTSVWAVGEADMNHGSVAVIARYR